MGKNVDSSVPMEEKAKMYVVMSLVENLEIGICI